MRPKPLRETNDLAALESVNKLICTFQFNSNPFSRATVCTLGHDGPLDHGVVLCLRTAQRNRALRAAPSFHAMGSNQNCPATCRLSSSAATGPVAVSVQRHQFALVLPLVQEDHRLSGNQVPSQPVQPRAWELEVWAETWSPRTRSIQLHQPPLCFRQLGRWSIPEVVQYLGPVSGTQSPSPSTGQSGPRWSLQSHRFCRVPQPGAHFDLEPRHHQILNPVEFLIKAAKRKVVSVNNTCQIA